MKNIIVVMILTLGTMAFANESFKIESNNVPGTCDSMAIQQLFQKQISAAHAYCGTDAHPKLVDLMSLSAGGNPDCGRIWANYSSASAVATFECVSGSHHCLPNCFAYGVSFELCHSRCGAW